MVTATETPETPVANGVAKPKQKLSKNQLRRAKKRQQKQTTKGGAAVESESESVHTFPPPIARVTCANFEN